MRCRTVRRHATHGGFLAISALAAAAALLSAHPASASDGPGPAPVRSHGETILVIHAPVGDRSPRVRAVAIEERLARALARAPGEEAAAIRPNGDVIGLYVGDDFIMSITDADGAAIGRTRAQVAADDLQLVRRAIHRDASTRTLRGLATAVGVALGETLALLLALFAFSRMVPPLQKRLREESAAGRLPALRLQRVVLVSSERMSEIAASLIGLLRGLLTVGVVVLYLNLVLALFPGTRSLSAALFHSAGEALSGAGHAILRYLPNLGTIALVVVGTAYILKAARFGFREIRRGRIVFAGFHREWAEPTYKIVRFLVIALAVVIVVPYLPASGSPAFRGISIFFGVLVSFAGGSSISNVIAGTILTYMRPFGVGDRVQIGDTRGDVEEMTMLGVRLRTNKNVEVTIPNSLVLGAHIVNYSGFARTRGLILHCSVSIGYDAPWRRVHELLIAGALATDGILKDPPPFARQLSLDDFYVTYEINAYTDQPNHMGGVTSRLLQNVQDRFNEAGIEIMSPHYAAHRDGNAIAIPERYRPRDYEAPSFRVQSPATTPPPRRVGEQPPD